MSIGKKMWISYQWLILERVWVYFAQTLCGCVQDILDLQGNKLNIDCFFNVLLVETECGFFICIQVSSKIFWSATTILADFL